MNIIKSFVLKLPSFNRVIWAKRYLAFLHDYLSFRKINPSEENRFLFKWSDRWPCLYDKTENTSFDRHYIYHTAWAARALVQIKPKYHVDIASSLYFCSLVSAFLPIKFYDYRPANLTLSNLMTDSADLNALSFQSQSIESLSCMHVVEHVGLGRYGDALRAVGRTDDAFQQYAAAHRRSPDADAWQEALAELDPRAALPILEAHVKDRPTDASGHGNYGVALAAAGRTSESVTQLERALAEGDSKRWYEALKKVDAARALEGLERRSRADASDDRVWGLLGRELHALHRDAEARAAYERASQIDPSDRDWARAIRDLR